MKPIVEAKPPWLRGGVARVCEKCTHERYVEDFPKAPRRAAQRERVSSNASRPKGAGARVRVVTSRCLDVCARGSGTVLLAGLEDSTAACCIVADPLAGREARAGRRRANAKLAPGQPK
jgi:hypothetical protein